MLLNNVVTSLCRSITNLRCFCIHLDYSTSFSKIATYQSIVGFCLNSSSSTSIVSFPQWAFVSLKIAELYCIQVAIRSIIFVTIKIGFHPKQVDKLIIKKCNFSDSCRMVCQ